MSASKVQIRLSCSNVAAQLLVVDGQFGKVASGASPLEAEVEPGIYSLKAKIGDATSEQVEVLRERGKLYEFELKAPQFESAMPIDGTSTHREYQDSTPEAFTGISPQVIPLGNATSFVLYVRDTSRTNFDLPEASKAEYAANFDGFRLLSPDGSELVDFDLRALKNIEFGYIGAQVGLDAGAYVLAWQRGSERVCLPVYTVPGLALQIYLALQPVSESSIEMRPDFREASYVFDVLTSRFARGREDLNILESVRLALEKGQNVVQTPPMRQMLSNKFQNPMLGLYAAHILLADKNSDSQLLEDVINNTADKLKEDFPDVVGLAWGYERLTNKRPSRFNGRPWPELLKELKGPPLLVRSWDLLVACTQIVTAGRFESMDAFHVAGDLVAAGIYLTWEARVPRKVAQTEVARESGPAPSEPTFITKGYDLALDAIVKFTPHRVLVAFNQVRIVATEIRDSEEAAAALQILARKYQWDDVLEKIRRTDKQLALLTGLQLDLIAVMRQADSRRLVRGLDAGFVDALLKSKRIPIDSLAEALAGLDDTATQAFASISTRAPAEEPRISAPT